MFSIRDTICWDREKVGSQSTSGGRPKLSLSRKCILIVDSDKDVRDVFVRMVKKIGFRAVPATTGSDALAKFIEATFDVVMSDYQLVDMNGLELARRLKGLRPGTPVLLMTAFLDQTTRNLIEAEGQPLITKPLLRHELKTALRDLLGKNSCETKKREFHP